MRYEAQTFDRLDLQNTRLADAQFIECRFSGCNLTALTLENCAFTDCVFTGCRIVNPKSLNSRVKNTAFQNCSLVGVNWGSVLPGGRVQRPIASLKGSTLKYNSFTEMKLAGTDFSLLNIQDSIFDGCALGGADFRECGLEGTQFTHCDLQKADFRDAVGYLIDLESNRLKGAKFSYPEVVGLLHGLDIVIE